MGVILSAAKDLSRPFVQQPHLTYPYRIRARKPPVIHPGDEAPFLIWRGEGSAQGFSKVEGVKKTSQSSKMKVIEKHFHEGETRNGLYYIGGTGHRNSTAAL